MSTIDDVQKHSVHTLVFRSLKRTHDMFLSDQSNPPPADDLSERIRMSCRARDEYGLVMHLVKTDQRKTSKILVDDDDADELPRSTDKLQNESNEKQSGIGYPEAHNFPDDDTSYNTIPMPDENKISALVPTSNQLAAIQKKAATIPKPKWHAPWKLYRVISGHLGWVRCIAVEPGNQWFATGSADRIIKIWDLASGKLKLSLTGHISTVRGLAVSPRQPYLFSCGEDKQVKCWDLEYNKVIRHYHGHLSAVYGLALHPTIDVLASCGRDSVTRIWDMRTKANIHTLTGHTNTVASVLCQAAEPQIITGSHDCTIRLWDLVAGKTKATLTNHKKSVRALVVHPTLYMFGSGAPDNIKQWKCPEGKFIQNLSGHNAIVNCLAINPDGVMVSGGDNGSMHFWDWKTGYNFQRYQAAVQPGSIDSESGIFAMSFDHSGSRLITAEADKTIKIYREDDQASEETHPVNWKPNILKRQRY